MIVEIFRFVINSKVSPSISKEEWIGIISYLLEKGWLWISENSNGIKAVVGAYRISKFRENNANEIPIKEEGKILFIPFACSIADNRFIWRKMIKEYLKTNEIEEIIFCDYAKDGYEKYRRFKIRSNK